VYYVCPNRGLSILTIPFQEKKMKKFRDKTVIVTGGASGIGRAICENIARHGAIVTVADINLDGAKDAADFIIASGGRAKAVRLDVTKKDKVQKLVKDTADENGHLDYIFNNAGIGIIGDERYKTLDEWQEIIDVNLMGVIYGTLAAYHVMVKQGSGHIVNTASIAGLMPAPTEVSYGTTKHAVVGLSTSLRAEGAALGVKVSAVCPGVIRTPFFDASRKQNDKIDKFLAKYNPVTMNNVDRAARIILRGVARNKAFIVFPFYIRLLWWMIRVDPRLIILFGRFNMRRYRRMMRDSSSQK
jgi:NAD(P)-dependent dehydrogenase (short-subunit alcohol dehydrogenase family)